MKYHVEWVPVNRKSDFWLYVGALAVFAGAFAFWLLVDRYGV